MPSPSSPSPPPRPDGGASPAPARHRAWIVVGVLVTLGLLAWALHGVSLGDVARHVARADPWLMLATVALATLTFPIRTARWHVILRDSSGAPYPLLPLWHATAIGFMANNLLPARAGEFARAYAARQQLPVSFATALASVGVERVFDGLMLVGLMTLAISSPSFPRHALIGGTSVIAITRGGAALFGVVLVVAALVVHRPAPWLTWLRRLTHAVFPEHLAGRITRIAEALVAGLEVLKRPGRFVAVVAWSVVLWLVNAAAFAVCFRAFGLAVPPGGALLLQGIIGFGVALPSSPGFVGVFEAATRVTLALYGVDATPAVSYAVAYHASTFLPVTLLGLYSLSRLRLGLRELRTAAAEG